MAKKPSITTVASGYQSTATLNSNFTNVRDAFDNTLSLDGSTPNAMQADLDMNSYDILNANSITTDTLTVDGVDITVVNEVKLNIADITTVANNITDVNTVAADIYGVTNVSDAIDNGDLINDVYQGAHSADPTVRLNSNPLQNGDIYFNTNTTRLRTYANGSWYDTGAGGNTDAALVTYLQAGTGALTRTTQARLRDVVSVKDFGAVGDGVTNDAPAVQACLTYCAANNKVAYAPAGTYLLGAKVSVTGCNRIGLVGDGSGVTVFKRADNVVTTSFTEMFSFTSASAASASFVGRGFSVDGNARGNQIPVNITLISGTFQVGEALVGKDNIIGTVSAGQLKFTRYLTDLTAGEVITGATSGATASVTSSVSTFLWQQSHCVRIAPTGLRGFNHVVFDDIYGYDATADVLGIGGNSTNTCGTLLFTNVFVDFRQRSRSDIVVTACYDTLSIANCSVTKTEVELNTYNAAQAHNTNITNLVTETLDMAAEQSTDLTGWPKLNVSNTTVKSFAFMQNFAASYNNCSFTLTSAFRVARGFAEFNNCKFFVAASFVTPTSTQGVIFEAANNTNTRFTAFRGCTFDADPAATFTYYYSAANTWGSDGTDPYCKPYVFENCVFRQSSRAAIYIRSGQFSISNCTFDAASAAIVQGTTSSAGIVNKIWITNCTATDTSGYIYQPPSDYGAGQPVSIWMGKNQSTTLGQIIDFTRYDKIAAPHGSAVAPSDVLNFKAIDREYESSVTPTTGKWLKGSIIWNSTPAAAGKVGWVVTTSGNIGTAVFKPFGAIDA